jgi:putative SbcD/Mre11-related phosphoesterase
MSNFIFLSKSLFFPEKGILVVGDLHIGYEARLRQSGVLIPKRQIKDLINGLKEIFNTIEIEKKHKIKKIVFLGDIKHAFGFESEERNEFQEVLEFLGEKFPAENIILLKGNHDTMDYTFEGFMKDFYIEDEIVFIHGDEFIKEAFDKKIKIIVMGHIHPSVILAEEEGVKKESYKCFLEGKFKDKKIIILPSFLDFIEGSPVNNYKDDYEDYFSIIPKKALMKFKVHVIGEDQVYEFGEVKNLL